MDIIVNTNGPLKVSCKDLVLKDPAGKAFDLGGREFVSLCRCGHSENKPFCDGSHRKANFQSECLARALPPPAPKPPA